MKKLILLFLIGFSNLLSANDIVIINDGSIIEGEIVKFAKIGLAFKLIMVMK